MLDPQTGTARPRVNGGWPERATAASGARGRCDDGKDLKARIRGDGAERRDREAPTAK